MKNKELNKAANRFGNVLKSYVKHLATGISLAVVLFFSAGAYAQTESKPLPFAMGVDAGMGLFAFPGLDGGNNSYYTADILLSGYYDLHPNWSLTLGLGYQYQFANGESYDDVNLSEPKSYFVDRHYFRTQFGAEFHKKWFYVKAGLFFERGTEPWVAANTYELFLFGGFAQPGVRISLTDKSSLRFGLQMNYGKDFVQQSWSGPGWRKEDLGATKAHHRMVYNMICVGYEYHF